MEGRLKILAVIYTIVEHAAGFVNLFTIMMGKILIYIDIANVGCSLAVQ